MKKTTPQKRKTPTKKNSTTKLTTNTLGNINELAHEGSKKAIEQLEKIIATEKDPEIKEYAKVALEECQFFYYSPENEKEEKEFLLLKLIDKKEEELFSEEMKLEDILFQEEKSNLFDEITKKLIQNTKDKKQKEDFKEYLIDIPDILAWEGNRKQEVEKKIAFLEAWLQEAKKHITVEKYKNIPWEVLSHMFCDYEDFEDEDEQDSDECCNWEDECCDECDDDQCCSTCDCEDIKF